MDVYVRMEVAHADIDYHVRRLSSEGGGMLIQGGYLKRKYGTSSIENLEVEQLEEYAVYLRSLKGDDLLRTKMERSLWVLWD